MDNYGLYIAKVVGTSSDEDSRLQVKVLPFMEDIEDGSCPKWPFFFKDELYSGKANELVWVVCDDHFNIGFILGPTNYTTYISGEYSSTTINGNKVTLSISQKNLLDAITKSAKVTGALAIGGDSNSNFSTTDMKVSYWSSSCIHFVDRKNGGLVIAYSNGSILVMSPSKFFVHIGSSSRGATIKMDSEGFNVCGSSVKLQGDYVGLGKSPKGKILVTEGATAEGGKPSSSVEA